MHAAVGRGHLYQGRFKSFPIQADDHLLAVLRYVEGNPVRTKLVSRAQDWRWGSCYVRRQRGHVLAPLLSDWPVPTPGRWLRVVNEPQTAEQEAAVQHSVERLSPLGDADWTQRTAKALKLESTLRPRGRPAGWRKVKAEPKKSSTNVDNK